MRYIIQRYLRNVLATVTEAGLHVFSFFLRTIGLLISPYQKFAELRQEFVATVMFTTKRFVRAESCG
jgi:hypothetical protein